MQGFAYIEFLEADAVDNAIMLDNSELRGRQIKVGAFGHIQPVCVLTAPAAVVKPLQSSVSVSAQPVQMGWDFS